MKGKRGQFSNPMFIFVGIVAVLVFLAPVYLKIFTSIQAPISSQLANMTLPGAAEAQTNWNAVMTPAVTMWDKVMIFSFITVTLLLFVSAFMIDTHPLWVIMYIMSNFILVLFMPGFISAADSLYENAAYATEVAYLPFMDSLRTHYMAWMLGIMFVGGVIIYGKISLFGSSGGGARSNGAR